MRIAVPMLLLLAPLAAQAADSVPPVRETQPGRAA